MNNGFTSKRIPTLFALLILVGTIGVTLNLVNSRSIFISRASTESTPKNIKIANITDSSFNVSFTTDTKSKSFAIININGSDNFILDDRDKSSGQQKDYIAHFITIPNLTPITQYSFKLQVNGNEYINEEFKLTTGPVIDSPPPTQKEIAGRLDFSDNNDASAFIITAKLTNSQLIAGITDTDGFFNIPTNYIRNENLNSFLTLNDNDIIMFEIYGDNVASNVKATYYNAKNLPTIIIGENYNFLTLDDVATNKSSGNSYSKSFNELIDENPQTKINETIKYEELNSSTFSGKKDFSTESIDFPAPTSRAITKIEDNGAKGSSRSTAAMTGISLSMILIGIVLLVAL